MAVFVGEILPVWIQTLEGTPSNAPGAKKSMFASLGMFVPTAIIYAVLALLFWWLYRKLHWLIIITFAALLGVIMEFSFMRPQEAGGPNVVENPLGALIFFIIIWPILLGLPYGIFQGSTRLLKKAPNQSK